MKLITKPGLATQLREQIKTTERSGLIIESVELTRNEFYSLKGGGFIRCDNHATKDPLETYSYSFDGYQVRVVDEQGREVYN